MNKNRLEKYLWYLCMFCYADSVNADNLPKYAEKKAKELVKILGDKI